MLLEDIVVSIHEVTQYQSAFSNMIENRTHVLALLKRSSQVRQESLFARIPKVLKLIIDQ